MAINHNIFSLWILGFYLVNNERVGAFRVENLAFNALNLELIDVVVYEVHRLLK